MPHFPSLRTQTALQHEFLTLRLRNLLPRLMEEAGLDFWLLAANEYNEDPALLTLLEPPVFSSRRHTVVVVEHQGDHVVPWLIAPRSLTAPHFELAFPEGEETPFARAARLLAERGAQTVGINTSADWPFADGLSHSQYEKLVADAPNINFVSAAELAVSWLETRIPEEIAFMHEANRGAHALIARAFSPEVIIPEVTTPVEVAWWLRETAAASGAPCWFPPSVAITRYGEDHGGPGSTPDVPIKRGDLLHVDFGVHVAGLATDTQQNTYVLRPGEEQPPHGIRRLLAKANLQQDLLRSVTRVGISGNEALRLGREKMIAAGLVPSVYCHGLGVHGHGAGAPIGMWDKQEGVPVRGERLLRENTVHAWEMNHRMAVPEWDNQMVTFATEQGAVLTQNGVAYLDRRQEILNQF